ncbi:MAG: putative toxin-antitoxin system toxin component, PIN family [Candidatus Woesearchaeota archaeon]
MGKKRVVLDANIVISALGWPGKPRSILESIIKKEIELVLSMKILSEISRVSDYPKLGFSKMQKERLISLLLEIAEMIEPKNRLNIVKDDPTDNKFIECAFEGKADYIITGDNHLLKLKEYKGIRIVTPEEFIKELR